MYLVARGSSKIQVVWELCWLSDTNYKHTVHQENQYSRAAPIEINKLRKLWYSLGFYMLRGLIGTRPWRASVWQWSMNLPIRKSSVPCVSAWNDLGSVWESSSEVKQEDCGALHLWKQPILTRIKEILCRCICLFILISKAAREEGSNESAFIALMYVSRCTNMHTEGGKKLCMYPYAQTHFLSL